MQSSSRPLMPVPRSPPLGPQNSVALSTMKIWSFLPIDRVKVDFLMSTDFTTPEMASLGTENFLSLSPPADAWASRPRRTTRVARPTARFNMVHLLGEERDGLRVNLIYSN